MNMILKTLAKLSMGSILFAGMSANVLAQGQYNRHYSGGEEYVTIFEKCEYRGKSRSVSVGNFSRMKDLGFGNDKMSSIRVPQGMEAVIFQNDKFKGKYARIDQDISCFDNRWDNEVSSMRVVSTQANDSVGDYSNNGYRTNDAHQNGGQRSHENSNYETRNHENRNGRKVTAKNVSQVVFANRVLQQTGKRKWQIENQGVGVSQYKEVSRDKNSVYLQNDYTADKVRIDLFANDVTFIGRNGHRETFEIQRKYAALNSKPRNHSNNDNNNSRNNHNGARSNSGQPNKIINSGCFNFKAYTKGGEGGIRFHGHEGFNRFGKKAYKGRICDSGEVTMEINKTQPGTEVIVEIKGRKFRFGANEKHDVLLNNWYRKKVTLTLKPH